MSQAKEPCKWCGYVHRRDQCPARGKTCVVCGKIGHFAKVCKSKPTSATPINEIVYEKHNAVEEYGQPAEEEEEIAEIAAIDDLFIGAITNEGESDSELWYVNLDVEDTPIRFKMDTGSEANTIPVDVFNKLHNVTMQPPRCSLITYSGHRIQPQGETMLTIEGRPVRFQVLSIGSPILGKAACVQMKLIARIDNVDAKEDVVAAESMVKSYNDIFTGLGLIKTGATIHIDNNVTPVIDPPRRIPCAIEKKVKNEIERMLKLGVIVKENEPTEWVNSITIVKKPDKIRICLDPTKLNRAILRGPYPTRTIEEVTAKTADAKYFSVLDANSGYWQIELDQASSKLCTFNTPWGRYRYTRLPFGIKTAGDIFIEEMNKILEGIPGVNVITDDILIYGRTVKEHNENLKAVLERAREVGLKLNPDKSKICKTEVNYVGHILTQEGLKPSSDRVQAIADMPTPTDKPGVQRFLGMIGYVSKFIPNLAEINKPLRILITKEVMWHWDYEQQRAFDTLKTLLINAPILRYYDVRQEIVLQVDASKSGLGAALIQEGRPVAMASKSLDGTQTNYAVIEKELLAICFGCKKFHEYIYGKPVTVETDHKPLVAIMQKPLFMLSARMQRMRMRLQNYDLNVIHVKGTLMYIADTLSRAHSTKTSPNDLFDRRVSIAEIGVAKGMMERIRNETKTDQTLTALRQIITSGWPHTCRDVPQLTRPFFTYRNAITIDSEMLLKDNRIIIPRALQAEIVNKIHETPRGSKK